MPHVSLFPLSEYWGLYLGFVSFVIVMLLLDLGVFHKTPHKVSMKESITWSCIWVSLAMVFNVGLYFYALDKFAVDPRLNGIEGFDPGAAAMRVAMEFLTGFTIEKALAVDNIFVFVLVFNYFAIPPIYQHRILFYGILGALVFRSIFIALGAKLLAYEWVVMVAGLFLIFTGAKLLFAKDKEADPGDILLVKLIRKVLPVTDVIKGKEFFVHDGVRWVATPLFLALAAIEFSDIIFAIDSVPAIFAVTDEPFIVFTSNIFAILGLRALYFLLAGVVEKFKYIKVGLALILVFVGLKMTWLNHAFGGKFPIMWSLGIIAGILAGSIVIPLFFRASEGSTGPKA